MKKYSILSFLPLGFLLIFLSSCSVIGVSGNAVGYGPTTPDPCGVNRLRPNITFHDPTRQKEILVRVRVPTNCDIPKPIVIYSHGGGYDVNRNFKGGKAREWTERIARAGYVVIQISHQAPEQIDALCSKFSLTDSGLNDDWCVGQGNLSMKMSRFERTADVLAVVNKLGGSNSNLRATIDAAVSNADFDSVGVIGFSAGSQTAITIAGAVRKLDGAGEYPMMSDPLLRPNAPGDPYGSGLITQRTISVLKANVALSPQGVGYNDYYCGNAVRLNRTARLAFNSCPHPDNSFNDIDSPILLSTGSNDTWHNSPGNITSENRRLAFDLINPTNPQSPKYLLFIGNDGSANNEGASHGFFNFQDPPLSTMLTPAKMLSDSTIAFFDSQLRAGRRQDLGSRFLGANDFIETIVKSHPDDNSRTSPASPRQTEFLEK